MEGGRGCSQRRPGGRGQAGLRVGVALPTLISDLFNCKRINVRGSHS